jgi:serine/threonine protein kinase
MAQSSATSQLLTPTQHPGQEACIDFRSISFGKVLGHGSFGAVYLCKWQGTEVAVKAVKAALDDVQSQELLHEFKVTFDLRSPRIIQMLGYSYDEAGSMNLVLEYAPGGALRSLLDNLLEDDATPDLKESATWASDVAHGMEFLHSRGVMHCDLKTPNVLLDRADAGSRCKVADFGLAKARQGDGGGSMSLKTTTVKGSPPWMAPEAINGERTLASDVYSYGVLLWELITAGFPWKGAPFVTILYKVVMEEARPPGADPNHRLHDLMTRCWASDPDKRPTFHEAVAEVQVILDQGD